MTETKKSCISPPGSWRPGTERVWFTPRTGSADVQGQETDVPVPAKNKQLLPSCTLLFVPSDPQQAGWRHPLCRGAPLSPLGLA